MAWKTFVKDYLTFSKKERLAALVVIFILMALFTIPHLFSGHSSGPLLQEDSLLARTVDTLQKTSRRNTDENESPSPYSSYSASSPQSAGYTDRELFGFDPNTLPEEGWHRLGLNDKTIRILINYRNKGGRFYKPEDLKKVWTMPVGFYERVKGHISITLPEKPSSYPTFPAPHYTREERKIQPVNINEGDTADFIALPGIGPVLASRIIKFRDKLGGFHSIDQVGETYGLPDSTFQKLRPYFTIEEGRVRKLNLNTATKDELKAHPYIRWQFANAIVEYRNQHGAYQSIDDLKNILILDEATFQKIREYVTLE